MRASLIVVPTRYALALFGPMAARVGLDPSPNDSHSDAMLRSMLIGRAGKLGDEAVVAECKTRFAKFIGGDDKAVHPDIRGAVYASICLLHLAKHLTDDRSSRYGVVLKHGGKAEFDALVAHYDRLEAQDEKVAVLRSLGASLLPEVHQAVLDFAMSDKVRWICLGFPKLWPYN